MPEIRQLHPRVYSALGWANLLGWVVALLVMFLFLTTGGCERLDATKAVVELKEEKAALKAQALELKAARDWWQQAYAGLEERTAQREAARDSAMVDVARSATRYDRTRQRPLQREGTQDQLARDVERRLRERLGN